MSTPPLPVHLLLLFRVARCCCVWLFQNQVLECFSLRCSPPSSLPCGFASQSFCADASEDHYYLCLGFRFKTYSYRFIAQTRRFSAPVFPFSFSSWLVFREMIPPGLGWVGMVVLSLNLLNRSGLSSFACQPPRLTWRTTWWYRTTPPWIGS